ncbi:hypothetical protein BJ742DRAFT_433796 [Cladochytrium replicatum]|nr:hypothetical protein BJ742DRAFT_433796 [Cladochytrium replicatum]
MLSLETNDSLEQKRIGSLKKTRNPSPPSGIDSPPEEDLFSGNACLPSSMLGSSDHQCTLKFSTIHSESPIQRYTSLLSPELLPETPSFSNGMADGWLSSTLDTELPPQSNTSCALSSVLESSLIDPSIYRGGDIMNGSNVVMHQLQEPYTTSRNSVLSGFNPSDPFHAALLLLIAQNPSLQQRSNTSSNSSHALTLVGMLAGQMSNSPSVAPHARLNGLIGAKTQDQAISAACGSNLPLSELLAFLRQSTPTTTPFQQHATPQNSSSFGLNDIISSGSGHSSWPAPLATPSIFYSENSSGVDEVVDVASPNRNEMSSILNGQLELGPSEPSALAAACLSSPATAASCRSPDSSVFSFTSSPDLIRFREVDSPSRKSDRSPFLGIRSNKANKPKRPVFYREDGGSKMTATQRRRFANYEQKLRQFLNRPASDYGGVQRNMEGASLENPNLVNLAPTKSEKLLDMANYLLQERIDIKSKDLIIKHKKLFASRWGPDWFEAIYRLGGIAPPLTCEYQYSEILSRLKQIAADLPDTRSPDALFVIYDILRDMGIPTHYHYEVGMTNTRLQYRKTMLGCNEDVDDAEFEDDLMKRKRRRKKEGSVSYKSDEMSLKKSYDESVQLTNSTASLAAMASAAEPEMFQFRDLVDLDGDIDHCHKRARLELCDMLQTTVDDLD